jgi:hypothetical protein
VLRHQSQEGTNLQFAWSTVTEHRQLPGDNSDNLDNAPVAAKVSSREMVYLHLVNQQ